MKKGFILLFFLVLQLHADEDDLEQPPIIEQVLSFQLTVSDMDQSVLFYTQILNFVKESDAQVDQGEAYNRLTDLKDVKVRVVQLRLGDEYLVLKQYLHPKGREMPENPKNNDPWYHHIAIVVSDMDRAFRMIHSHHYRFISTSPQIYPSSYKELAGISEFYFKDPDGHPIAIIHYPRDKGARKWHMPTNRIFLGIDHIAIVVKNAQDSLGFYQKLLGFKATITTLKHGRVQENLSHVLGARVRSVMFRPPRGPGIQLMEYLHPPTEKLLKNTKVNDIWYEQVNTVSKDIDKVYDLLKDHNTKMVSQGIQDFHRRDFRAFIAEDPDGHAILFSERKLLRDERTYFRREPASP